MTVVMVLDMGRRGAVWCTTTLHPMPADWAPPGGEVVLVAQPPNGRGGAQRREQVGSLPAPRLRPFADGHRHRDLFLPR